MVSIKKVISLCMAMTLLMFALSGCGNTQQADENKTSEEVPATSDAYQMPDRIIIGATDPDGSWYLIAVAMKNVIEKAYPQTRVDIYYGDAIDNLNAINEGNIDFGITTSEKAVEAVKGKGDFIQTGILNNVCTTMGLWKEILYMVTSADSKINSLADLKGKTVSTGLQQDPNTTFFNNTIKAYGITAADLTENFAVLSDMQKMFGNGELDLFAFRSTQSVAETVLDDVAGKNPIKLVGFSSDIMARLMKNNPGYFKAVISANSVEGQTEDVITQGDVVLLACRKDLDKQLVYNVVSTLIKNSRTLAQSDENLSYISKENCSKGLGIGFHNGAMLFYKE